MYHTEQINQVKQKEKSLLSKSFSQNNLQTVFTGDIDKYLDSCTPFQKKIAHYILRFRHMKRKILTNERIALEIGCSVKTVIRATNQFLKDLFITKHQHNKYDPNYYSFNDKITKGKYAFSHWMNSLSPNNQYLYNTHGIRVDHKNRIIYSPRNVPLKNSNLILDSLFINLSLPLTREGGIFNKIKVSYGRKDPQRRRWDPQKGMNMYNFQDKPFVIAKTKEKKRNPGGHSPMIMKQPLSLNDQIKELRDDIMKLSEKIALNIYPSHIIAYTMTIVDNKTKELRGLEARYGLTAIYH